MTGWTITAIFSAAYLLGSIPFGLILTRLAGIGDIRSIGSGNIGATNVMRTGRKGLGALTLLLDAAKGYAAVALAHHFFQSDIANLAGVLAVIGHIFPVWLGFRGGKGVATAIGVFFAINPLLGLTVCGLWLLSFAFMRISSLSSMISIGYSSIAAYVLDNYPTALICLTLGTLIVFTHRSNIKRLLQGTEHSFRKGAL